MKKNLLFVLLAALGLSLVMSSCQKAPELTITGPTNIELSADGSSASITFIANRDWTITSSDSWVSVSPSSGTAVDGTVTVNVRCSANTTYEDRTATVTVTMEGLTQTVTVRQPANLGIVLPTQAFDLQSGAKNIDVTVQANVDYSVDISAKWIKQTGTKALTSKTLTFSIEENTTYDSREGKITLKPKQAGVAEQVISVKQAQKDAIKVEKTSYDMPYGGGEIEIKVEANVPFDVTPNVDWLHYIQTKGLSNSTVFIKVDENPTYSNREGKIEIAQQNGSLKYTVTVKQAGRIAVSSIELDKTSLTLKPGEKVTLVATVKPDNATDKTVTWSSSDSGVATVDETGKVTAIKVGSATITAKAGEKTAECKVNILIPVSSIVLNKTELDLFVGDSETLVATITPNDATEKTVTWSSSNTEVATVDANGKVTAKKEGFATITVKAGEKSAACSVTVSKKVITVESITLNKSTLELEEGGSEPLVATVKPDDATDKTVTWSSSNTAIATVDTNGKVTAVKEGTATITAKAGEKSATCSVTVYFVPAGAVDLGVVIARGDGTYYRLFWAECNLGASSPEEFGDYYAWGESDTKDNYTWKTYKWANGASNKLTKYCRIEEFWDGNGSPDGKTELDLEDDVAHVKLGGNWRMPTKAELEALCSQCAWAWTTKNGVNGYEVKSKVNSNSIFLSAAGNRQGTSLYSARGGGYYWSSSLNMEWSHYAHYLLFNSSEVFPLGYSSSSRPNGFSIRPVTE